MWGALNQEEAHVHDETGQVEEAHVHGETGQVEEAHVHDETRQVEEAHVHDETQQVEEVDSVHEAQQIFLECNYCQGQLKQFCTVWSSICVHVHVISVYMYLS